MNCQIAPDMSTLDPAPALAAQALQLAAEGLLALADVSPDEEGRPGLCPGCDRLAGWASGVSELPRPGQQCASACHGIRLPG